MLVDKHKPLRTGDGVKWNSSDEKIKGWMKGLKLEPRLGVGPGLKQAVKAEEEEDLHGAAKVSAHRTAIPPHLHRPWHSTYTGHVETAQTPKIKYGTFIRSRATGDDLTNILELSLPANLDAKTRKV
jgi:aarF domain-containing kinase